MPRAEQNPEIHIILTMHNISWHTQLQGDTHKEGLPFLDTLLLHSEQHTMDFGQIWVWIAL
jgi:hypothetical protein